MPDQMREDRHENAYENSTLFPPPRPWDEISARNSETAHEIDYASIVYSAPKTRFFGVERYQMPDG